MSGKKVGGSGTGDAVLEGDSLELGSRYGSNRKNRRTVKNRQKSRNKTTGGWGGKRKEEEISS